MIINIDKELTKGKNSIRTKECKRAILDMEPKQEYDFIKNSFVSNMYNKLKGFLDTSNNKLIVNISGDKPKSRYKRFVSEKTIKNLFNESNKRAIIEKARNEEDEEFVKYLEGLYINDEYSLDIVNQK